MTDRLTPFRVFCFLLCILFICPCIAQSEGPPSSAGDYEERYKQRIKEEYLYGVYIPADLPEAIRELYKKTSEDSRRKFAEQPEAQAVKTIHFSLGLWIIHNWGFYGGSRLSEYFRSNLQIYHPDDMAEFIMIAFHRSINEKPLEVPELMEEFHLQQDSVKQAKNLRDSLGKQ